MSARQPGDSRSFAAFVEHAAFELARLNEISEAKQARDDVLCLSDARTLLQSMGLMKVGGSNVGALTFGVSRQVKGGAA